MHDVFISYSTKDLSMAETVRNVLERNEIPCWMAPRDIPGGSNYSREIPIAIRGCKVFVIVLSENSQRSPWVLRELDMAVNCGKLILPFMLDDFPLNDEFNFLLTGAQRYAAYQEKAAAMEKLIIRIRAVTDGEKRADAADVPPREDAPAQPAETVPEVRPEAKTSVQDAFLGMGRCPACGSEQLKQLKKVGKYVGGKEKLYSLWNIAACAGGFVVGLIVLTITYSFWAWLLSWVLSTVGAIILVHRATDKCVHRLRVRRHILPHPFRCEKCDWVFLLNEDGSNMTRK